MPFQPGNNLGKGRPTGSKNIITLDKEARRARFDAKISEKWDQVIDKLPPVYVADQFIGKAPETLKHQIEFIFDEDTVE